MMMKKMNNSAGNCLKGAMEGIDWEMRPGGMLVQKRNTDSPNISSNRVTSTVKIKVKYGSFYNEIDINSHADFGELKKMLAASTGLHPKDQKLIFKCKERDSKACLDIVGVKDGSEVILIEDIMRQERGFLESRTNASMAKAFKSVLEVTIEVDKLGGQVTALETVIMRGGKVAEKELLNLIELLMSQLIKLDGIMADGEVKLKRKMQVIRVQKYIETLDKLKAQNAIPSSHGLKGRAGQRPTAMAKAMQQQ